MVRLFRAKVKTIQDALEARCRKFGILTLDLWALVRLVGYSSASLVTNSKPSSWKHGVTSGKKERSGAPTPTEMNCSNFDLKADRVSVD